MSRDASHGTRPAEGSRPAHRAGRRFGGGQRFVKGLEEDKSPWEERACEARQRAADATDSLGEKSLEVEAVGKSTPEGQDQPWSQARTGDRVVGQRQGGTRPR